MARHYYVRCDYTPSEGDSLHAGWAKEGLLGDAEAVYEDSTIFDTCVVLPYTNILSGSGYQLALGPHPVPMRYDRDGLLRRLYFEPLVSAGTAASLDWHVFLTDDYREPDTTEDPSAAFQTTSSTVAYLTAGYIQPPREWTCRSRYSFDDGEDRVRVVMGWVTLYCVDPGSDKPKVAGLHIYDHVDVS